MKIIKLFIISVLFTLTANSQITKGNWLMGGNASISYTKSIPKQTNTYLNSAEGKTFSILLQPNIGYFVVDKFAIGLKLGVTNTYPTNQSFQINQTQFSISPFLRYYLLKTDKPFNIFVERLASKSFISAITALMSIGSSSSKVST